MTKNSLKDESLASVTGGGEYTLYNYEFNDSTKISEILEKFPWLTNLNSDLSLAASFGLTVGKVKLMKKWTDADIEKLIEDGEALYNEDGTLKEAQD